MLHRISRFSGDYIPSDVKLMMGLAVGTRKLNEYA
jgi:hypothetical protein